MKRIAMLVATLAIPLLLAACGGGGADASAEETTVREAVAFITTTDGTPGVFVAGRDVVLNYAQRPPTYADHARKAALDASKATGGKSVKVYVIDSGEVATAVPGANQYYCRIEAFDGRMAGNTC
jgi:ABC-type glycerol-3-phosphate transport system substrate-binding protein